MHSPMIRLRTTATMALALALTSCGSKQPQPVDAMWTVRLDSSQDRNAEDRFRLLPGGGIDVKGGANATLWRPDVPLIPPYRLSMRITAKNLELHPHGAGLVFGGTDVEGDQQRYSYFLVRGDGSFLIKTRHGGDTEDICLWTEHEAIHKEGKKDGIATNVLSVDVGKETTKFSINGSQVHAAGNEELPTSGRYGARLVHDLDARFDRIEIAAKKK